MNEDAFFSDLFSRLPQPPASVVVAPGDDCAALDAGNGQLMLLAVDQLVGGSHYLLGENEPPPAVIGRKLLARNLSDVAAMGGTPTFCLVALTSPPERTPQWLAEVLAGIRELAAAWGMHMIGGDLARSRRDEVGSLTILGTVARDKVCTRQGAAPGDILVATGLFGASFQTGHHLSFAPRLAEGQWLAGSGGVSAMIDVSDGLLLDASRLSRHSGTGLVLDVAKVPKRLPDLADARLLGDGEDYELLAAVKAEAVSDLLASWPFASVPLTPIGRFETGPAGVLDSLGRNLLEHYSAGYDHLSRPGGLDFPPVRPWDM